MSEDASKRVLYEVENKQRYLFFNNKQYLNLSSNDYLSLTDINLQQQFIKECNFGSNFLLSNPSSRLMTGNSSSYTELERSIASLFRKESSLVLSSGFMVNSALLPAITTKKDLVIADKLIHASVINGLQLCECDFLRFKHNDLEHLKSILEQKRASYEKVYVVTESIFSMDGDIAPLKELVELKKSYELTLYVDEAHAFGVVGENGCGVASKLGLLDQIDIIVVTLGKAIASQGGVVICSQEMKEVLINKMRTLIFSTAMPDISLLWSKFIIDRLPQMEDRRLHLSNISEMARVGLGSTISESHIIPIIIGGNEKTVAMQRELSQDGYWVTAIRHPTVAKGTERLRVSLSSSITESEVANFIATVKAKLG